MASIPTPIDFADLLDCRIPDRMKEVYLCAKFAEFVKAHGYNHKVDLQFSEIGGYQLASTELVGTSYSMPDSLCVVPCLIFLASIIHHATTISKKEIAANPTTSAYRTSDLILDIYLGSHLTKLSTIHHLHPRK